MQLLLLSCLIGVVASNQSFASEKFKLAFEIAPPFTYYNEQGQIQGLALELIEELVSQIGGELTYVTCPWARCLRLVESGDADFIFGIIKTKAREQKLQYIEPAFTHSFTEIAFYQLKNSKVELNNIADLEKLTIGIQRGALHFPEFDLNNKINKVEVVDIASIIQLLKKKRIDAFVMPKQSAEKYLAENDTQGLIEQSNYVYQVRQGGYVALSKKSIHLDKIEKLNNAMSQIRNNGRLQQILAKYQLSI